MDEAGEPDASGNCTACGPSHVLGGFSCADPAQLPGHVLGKSSCADPAWLPGHTNGLLDAGGTSVVSAGTVLAPALEPVLANGDGCPTVLPSWSPCPSAYCCVVILLLVSASVLVPFFGLMMGGSDTPSAGPLLHVILPLEDISPLLPINSKHLQNLT